MSTETITIAYTGNAVDDGKMAVSELAPALLALGNLVTECNAILNGSNSKISVYVKSDFEKGSFEINFDIIHSLVQQLNSLFKNDVSLADLLALIGIKTWQDAGGMASACGSLIAFIKWLRQGSVTKIRRSNDKSGGVTVEKENGDTTFVSEKVLNLYRSYEVQEQMYKLLEPLEEDGISGFEVREHKEKTTVLRINAEEIAAFRPKEKQGKIVEEESQKTLLVNILNVSFEELKWRLSDGADRFYATMEDEEFVRKINAGDIAFKQGDTLRVELTTKQFIDKNGKISTEKKVTKVIEYIPRPENMQLPFIEDDEE